MKSQISSKACNPCKKRGEVISKQGMSEVTVEISLGLQKLWSLQQVWDKLRRKIADVQSQLRRAQNAYR